MRHSGRKQWNDSRGGLYLGGKAVDLLKLNAGIVTRTQIILITVGTINGYSFNHCFNYFYDFIILINPAQAGLCQNLT